MDDTLQNIFFGLCSFLVVRGTFEGRARHGAERQVREAFHETGTVDARVKERGLFGYYVNDLYSVDISGHGMTVSDLPFRVARRGGWKGSIKHLRLDLRDFTLNGLPVHRLTADIPDSTYDLGWAFYRSRLQLRSAGVGPASVAVGADGLVSYINQKYDSTLSDVICVFGFEKITLSGIIRLFGVSTPFTAMGTLKPRESRFVDLTSPTVTLGGKRLKPQDARIILSTVNPLLDLEKDFGLRGFFLLDTISVGDRFLTLRGRMTIPEIRAGVGRTDTADPKSVAGDLAAETEPDADTRHPNTDTRR